MKKITIVMVFSNLNVAAFDENGEQVAELQVQSLLQLWIAKALSLGYDPDGAEVRTSAGTYRLNKE